VMKEEPGSSAHRTVETVPASTYSREYYLTECDGHDEFLAGRIPHRLQAAIRLAGQLEGKRVLDVGSGRGEITLHCAQNGADAYGLDYSPDALKLARTVWTVGKATPNGLAHFHLADAQHLPFKERSFDVALMLDIVEHLYPEQLVRAFREVHRTLKEDGLLIVHTMPNIWYYRIGYPLYRLVQRMRGQKLPRDPRRRWQFVPEVHVNEQDIFRLRRSLRSAGFQTRVWLQPTQTYHEEKNRVVRLLMRVLSSWYPFRWVFCDDIFALARKVP
jgi:ubiquinone/menaquinone biosynthesis C-methylase UbiE